MSGAAALIYEIVWLEMLQLVIGSTAVSLAVLLATFMGGLCLGSLLLPRFVPASIHPLRVFAWIELDLICLGNVHPQSVISQFHRRGQLRLGRVMIVIVG